MPPQNLTLPAALLGAAVLATATPARATDCTTLPDPVYVTGSTAVQPLLAAIASLAALGPDPTTIVYDGQGSCTGVQAILDATPVTGSGTYWSAAGEELSCDFPAAGVAVDVGVSDVFASTCVVLPGGLPSNVGDFLGPVQSMTFVVPTASTQTSISAEAAYFVYGFGAGSGVAPWTDVAAIFQRNDQSGTEQMIAAAIGVAPSRWQGGMTDSSGALTAAVEGSANPEATIGILAADEADDSRGALRVLAYQHYGQACGYLPDATSTSNEKRNVRDGHYAIWGPLHFLLHVDPSTGLAVNAEAGAVAGYLAGTMAAPPGIDLVAIDAQNHVVPQCAMQVTRTEEVGPLASFAPAGSCGCYYDLVANGSTSCAPCSQPTDCTQPGASVCSPYGYCEPQ
jgi:ABC-type phosphate transport system substrate-binding protein